MKPNEFVLTFVQLAAPIYCFSVGMTSQGVFLSLWIVVFGIGEVVCKAITGKTLSGNVWQEKIAPDVWIDRPKKDRIILSALMIAGMIALGYHFIWGHS